MQLDPSRELLGTVSVRRALLWTVLLASCSITHKSGDYACDLPTDCAPGRVCSGGYCVTTGQPSDAPHADRIDAPAPPIDAPTVEVCPSQCTSCNLQDRQCTIECGPLNNNCAAPVVCPPGYSCEIGCLTSGSCRSGVNCANAEACVVTCAGAGSCRDVTCGAGPCAVECSGYNSCERNIHCGAACQCDITCSGPGQKNCQTGVVCDDNACSAFDGGCTSTPAFPTQQCAIDCS